jgi:hypothetical protein
MKLCQKHSKHTGEKWLSAKANSIELQHTRCNASNEAAHQVKKNSGEIQQNSSREEQPVVPPPTT